MKAGLPKEVPSTSLNMMCGSGLRAVALGYQAILCGEASVVVAGGQESMSKVGGWAGRWVCQSLLKISTKQSSLMNQFYLYRVWQYGKVLFVIIFLLKIRYKHILFANILNSMQIV